MDIIIVSLAALLMVIGILGSFLPVIPGPFTSWAGLVLLCFTDAIPTNWTLIIVTFTIALIISIFDYILPSMATKRFGGSKAGVIGSSIGLIVGLLAPIPGGIIIGPFIGAFIGELINKSNSKSALKAAFGSFIGFLGSTLIKFLVTIIYLGLFISIIWEHRTVLFNF